MIRFILLIRGFTSTSRGRCSSGSFAAALSVLAVLLLLSSPLAAQAPTPAPPPTPTIVTRNLTMEYIIVVVMIGAALFAVCRSSRRN